MPLDRPWSAALTIPHDQVRVTFALPWEGMLLLGTTDTPYDGDPAVATSKRVPTVTRLDDSVFALVRDVATGLRKGGM